MLEPNGATVSIVDTADFRSRGSDSPPNFFKL
jgi:hypothetical protein